MSNVAIRVDNLGKRYQLRRATGQPRYRTLREELLQAPSRLWSAMRAGGEKDEEFWALRDVSFEVKQGEVLGVIGRNGAGKSTLLKILSRIVEPSEGSVDLYGRVGSLLEVGTGFHPELTGRENIFLSGAMLGMRRHEVRARLDEIVAFAEVEKFLDTPCKHYSSGMFMRLGFSVAAHLDAEILLVDEVLAVGDAVFQQKCLGKMSDAAQSGRTVLFISHNLAILHRLCTAGLLLGSGRSLLIGSIGACLDRYLHCLQSRDSDEISVVRSGFELGEFSIRNASGVVQNHFATVESIVVTISFVATERIVGLRCGFELISQETGGVIFLSFHDDSVERNFDVGSHRLRAAIPPDLLKAGGYRLAFAAGVHNQYWISKDEIFRDLSVENLSGVNSRYNDRRSGLIAPIIQWEFIE